MSFRSLSIILKIFVVLSFFGCNSKPSQPMFLNPLDLEGDFDNIPPVASFTIFPKIGVANETEIVLDASSSIEEDNPDIQLRYKWDFDNDGTWDTDWLLNQTVVRKFKSGSQIRHIKLLVMGGKQLQAEFRDSLFVNARPSVQYDFEYGCRDSVYLFNASNSKDYEDGENLNYRWDFEGDGSWDTKWISTSNIIHRYDKFQLSNVILEVMDTDSLIGRLEKEIYTGITTMIVVPAGSFTMGSDDDLLFDVKPAHSIYLDEYKIDRCEVTNGQYVKFLNKMYSKNEISIYFDFVYYGKYALLDLTENYQIITFNEGLFKVTNDKKNYPVEQVTWYGAEMYANYYGKRLPTEAEWEKANRGTDARTFPWGNDQPNANLCNCNLSYTDTTPIDKFLFDGSSFYGCADMAGNVDEWCADWYSLNYYQTSPQINPTGPETGSYKVVRGGNWASMVSNIYSYRRNSHHPVQGNFYRIGFRCAKDID